LALLLAVFIAGLTWAANAQEGIVFPLKWEVVDKPGSKGEIVLKGSEINRIATSGDVVYAVDTANSKLHRSGNGGGSFTDISSALRNSGFTVPIHEIAVAPGMPQCVAISDNISTVYWSTDSGTTWNNTNFPPVVSGGPTIQCIAISNGYLGNSSDLYHDLAVGTAAWGDTAASGQIWTVQVGKSIPSWQLQYPSNGVPGADVSAIAFSPKYKDDSTILAVASTDSATYLHIGARDLSLQTTIWNDFAGFAEYPVWINPVLGDASDEHIASSIALPSDYSGTDIKSRMVFVSCNTTQNDSANDVYRIYDNLSPQVIRLCVAGGAGADISSIAYYGTVKAGKLLAGGVDRVPPLPSFSVNLWRTTINEKGDVSWTLATQPPTGPGNAQVAWRSSGTAFCGTGSLITGDLYDESAFSRSTDEGDTWEQTSLINTLISMCDIAPAPDSRSLFMSTFSVVGPEGVWRSAGEPIGTYWTRLLTMRTSSDMVLLRLSPDYNNDDTIYAIEAGSDNRTLMSVSENRGNTWKKRYVQGPVIDMVAAGKYTLYMALPGGYIRKSTDGGLRWGDSMTTGLDNINMLALAPNGHLFAGSMDSKVAYSTDNGTSFIEIIYPIAEVLGTGFVQVAADANYTSNGIIYAADNVTGKGTWRRVIGLSTEWEQVDETIIGPLSDQKISSLMTGTEGTLYALRAERPKLNNRTIETGYNTGGMNRTLNPTADPPINIEWDIVNRTLTDNNIAFDPAPLPFDNNPPWLKLSGNSSENELWTIDTANLAAADDTALIYRFRDNLCKAGPWVNGPQEIGCDPVSGRNQGLGISWEQLSLSDRYDLQIAKDPAFTLRIDPAISNSDNISSVTGSIHIMTDPVNVTSPALWLDPGSLPEAGADYYWRIRTFHAATWEFIRSPWSGTARFMVKPGYVVNTPYPGPRLLSPEDGCGCPCNAPVSFSWSPNKEASKYIFEFSENADMSSPLVSANAKATAYQYSGQLECNRNYYWRVMALEPVAGDWSATFSFRVRPAPTYQTPAERNAPAPLWAWIVIAAGTVITCVLAIMLLRRQQIL
jgi:photosystem II stability/assembly factor-like uncharacterized protein